MSSDPFTSSSTPATPSEVRVRFAPSPTGMMHVGNARAALFNWLYARHTGGKFLVRVEDTDLERSTPEATQHILDSLEWLGLTPDEPIEYQSQRVDKHRAYLQKLLDSGHAYYDYTPKARLDELREQAQREGRMFVFRQSLIPPTEMEQYKAAGHPAVIRFRVPEEGSTGFDDLVYGRIEVAHSSIGDFVIARGDGTPLFLFSNAIDDADMRITHVCRGEDHVPNTPKQILLYRAMGLPEPQFAHLPMILGSDRQKLSKRHGAVRVMQFREEGILAPALVNFLALLGWAPEGAETEEVMTVEELIARFSLDRVNKSPAVFDYEKLHWMNGVYIRKMPKEDLAAEVLPRVKAAYPEAENLDPAGRNRTLPAEDWLRAILDLLVERSRTLNDFAPAMDFFFRAPTTYEEKGMKKVLSTPEQVALLGEVRDVIARAWDEAGPGENPLVIEPDGRYAAPGTGRVDLPRQMEQVVRAWTEQRGVKLGNALQPVRLALTGRTASPPLFEIILLLGREETLRRIDALRERGAKTAA